MRIFLIEQDCETLTATQRPLPEMEDSGDVNDNGTSHTPEASYFFVHARACTNIRPLKIACTNIKPLKTQTIFPYIGSNVHIEDIEGVGQKLERFGVKNATEKVAKIKQNGAMIRALSTRIKSVEEQKKDLPVLKLDDGTLIIQCIDLVSKETQSKILFSDPFYSEILRYKLCLEMNMVGNGDQDNGDQDGHLLILVHVMKGDFDSVLEWPFVHSVTVTMRGKKEEGDIVRTYQPNQEEVPTRPTPDQDIIFGGEFATYDQLQTGDFTRDGDIDLECRVNFH